MSERKHIIERIQCKTYIRGIFKGKFTGRLNREKSDEKHERYYDLEILEGEISSSQQQVALWTDGGESEEFLKEAVFPVNISREIKVSLCYLDGSVKYFMLGLQEIKLINCRLSKQVYDRSHVFGTLEGDISGYVLHHDTYLREIFEQEQKQEQDPKSENRTEPAPEYKSSIEKTGLASQKDFGRFNSLLRFVTGAAGKRMYSKLRGSRTFTYLLMLLVLFLTVFAIYSLNHKTPALSNVATGDTKENSIVKPGKDINRKDSFDRYFESGKTQLLVKDNKKALALFEKASGFASTSEKLLVNAERSRLYNTMAIDFEKKSKYKEAIEMYSDLISLNASNPGYLYKRAMCYNKTGKVREAVTDSKKAMDMGDREAQILYEKLNPLKKRIVGYITRCCDGTTSDARGRGACSHHDGVCDWNEPVYEEYRKYE